MDLDLRKVYSCLNYNKINGNFMEKSILLVNQEFESSCHDTPQFLLFYKTFKREFRRLLKDSYSVDEIIFSKGHFDVYGFFRVSNGKIYYFSIGDVRGYTDEGSMLIRSAKDFRDYTGGCNHYISLQSKEKFTKDLSNFFAEVD